MKENKQKPSFHSPLSLPTNHINNKATAMPIYPMPNLNMKIYSCFHKLLFQNFALPE